MQRRPGVSAPVLQRFDQTCRPLPAFLAFLLAFGVPPLSSSGTSRADALPGAARGFAKDSYSETGSSDRSAHRRIGYDRFVATLDALGEGDLYVRKGRQGGRHRPDAGGLALTDAADRRKPVGGDKPPSLKKVKVNNRAPPRHQAAIGSLDLLEPDPAKRLAAAETMLKSRDRAHCSTRRGGTRKEDGSRDPRRHGAARAAALLASDRPEADQIAAIEQSRARGGRKTPWRSCSLHSSPPTCEPIRKAAEPASPRSSQPRDVGRGPERLVRTVARLGAAPRRDRPRHHLRRDGRHQHGARRDGDARRLHDVRGAGDDPHNCARAVRLVAGDRHPARLPRLRYCGIRHRALGDPLALRTAARDAACHLGAFAHSAAGHPDHLRREQPAGR